MEDVVVLLPGEVVEGSTRTEVSEKSVWDRANVLMLIKEYRNLESHFKDHTIKRKILWRKISQKMRRNGVNVSWELCDKKWRNLKQTFKTIYTSKRNDESKRRWEFYSELEDIFGDDPNVKSAEIGGPEDPMAVVEIYDIDTNMCQEIEESEADSSNERCIYTRMNTDDNTNSLKTRALSGDHFTGELQNEQDAPLWFQEFIECFRENERVRTAMIKKMLEDVVKLEERKCEMLELLAERLSESSDL